MGNYKYQYYVHSKSSIMVQLIRDYLIEKGENFNYSIKYAFFRKKKKTKKTKVFEIDYDEMLFFAEKAREINLSDQIYFFHGKPQENFITQIKPKKRMAGIWTVEKQIDQIKKRKKPTSK